MPETVYDNPGPIPDVIAETGKIEDTWGNAIRDRVVNNFADAGERDDTITDPVEGMACYLADVHEFQVYNGVFWGPPWNLPWGNPLGDSVSTAQTGITAANTAVTGLSRTYPAHENRVLRVTVTLHMQSSDAGSATLINVVDSGGTVFKSHQVRHAEADSNDTFSFSYLEGQSASGTITRGVKVSPSSGTLAIASDVIDAEIWIEDAGQQGNPA